MKPASLQPRSRQDMDPSKRSSNRFSSLTRLLRVVARILQWRRKHRDGARTASPSANEIHNARRALVRAVQNEHFIEEMENLTSGTVLPARGHLRRLMPFMDNEGILRVGGRLQNAPLSPEEKHPAILPIKSHLSELLIRDAHQRTLYGGPQLIQATFYVLFGSSTHATRFGRPHASAFGAHGLEDDLRCNK